MSHDEIIEQLNKEFKINYSHEVISSFWKGVRYFISNPIEAKAKIMIPEFVVFFIGDYKIKKYLERMEHKEFKRYGFKKRATEFYTQLLDLIDERQKSSKVLDE
jgi:hypothetical protein